MAKRHKKTARKPARRPARNVDPGILMLNPPGEDNRGGPGSPEQQLDMCESGDLRGDEILHSHGIREKKRLRPELDEEGIESNFHFDMSEENREGSEESGDEHSSGLQGDEEQELQYDDHYGESNAGIPGEMTAKEVHENPLAPGHSNKRPLRKTG